VTLRKRKRLANIFNGNFKQSLLAGTLKFLMLFHFFRSFVLRNHSNLGPVVFLKEKEKLASEDIVISL
jgi:hypothetical protein